MWRRFAVVPLETGMVNRDSYAWNTRHFESQRRAESPRDNSGLNDHLLRQPPGD
ncbi:MAG: hypothetical protein ACKOGA_09355 [Planctomycetaceae bacterium]